MKKSQLHKEHLKLLFAALFFCGGALVGCTVGSQTREPRLQSSGPNTTKAPVQVHVFDVQPAANSPSGDLLIPAALSVEDTAIVLAERDGRVLILRAQEGMRVKKGDVLAQFNDEEQRSALRQAELDVSRLKVEEQQYDALVKLSRSELDRESLLAEQGLSSKSDVERAQYKLDQAIHEYEKTKISTESARARVEAARLELQKSVVRAPLTGVITSRHVTQGTNVARNDKLLEISSLSRLEVRFRLPQTEVDRFAPGRVINLTAVDSDRVIATARIKRIDPVADATSSTFGYVADVMGTLGLMPGLAVNIKIPRSTNSVSYWVPRAAFDAAAELHNGASGTVFVIDGQKASARTVLVSALEGDQVEVVTGLAEADRVVISPPPGLKDGDVVEVSRS
jgi:RND family efflux transporter MFP subunit